MKLRPFIFVLCLLFAGRASAAEILDLNTVKCKEWLDSSKENIGYTIAWLDGYYMDEDASPIINFDKMKENAGKLAGYCAANPAVGLGTAAEELFGE
ncbi:HdeA/HdeB family chaperone [Methylocapsa acidiphila]|uniref:HdeA/HdeB family chaperone n=1 Tax=Methylocapsa acidiphila TaxID=133552 RepID=UPI00040CA82A|nr:HdeA/HdeB family chaperone [Methylocapsa acidiphila]